ncbi:inhibitor of Brome mosaic virus [Phlyctochytrium planicorne]|nr:inhibitor of Brome mosaic virus [Phlyctochytrium planicorne]
MRLVPQSAVSERLETLRENFMPAKRKPGGLKKASSNASAASEEPNVPIKKAKLDIEGAKEDGTITVPIMTEGDEEENDFLELRALYETSLGKLGEGAAEEGAMLLRGVIHECDRMLRARDNAETNNDLEPLTWEFHFIYGSSLFRLGLLGMEEESEETSGEETPLAFLDAAIDRFEAGLEEESGKESWTLHQCLGRVLFEKANILVQSKTPDSVGDLVSRGLECFEKTISLLPSESKEEELIGLADIVLLHAESDTSEWEKHDKLWELARGWLDNVLKENPKSYEALRSKGSSGLIRANFILESAEGGDSEHMDELEGAIDDALFNLTEARTLGGEKDDVRLLKLLGETYVNKGNLLDERNETDDANDAYKAAVDCFKKVESLDSTALPNQFEEFIKSWEADADADD